MGTHRLQYRNQRTLEVLTLLGCIAGCNSQASSTVRDSDSGLSSTSTLNDSAAATLPYCAALTNLTSADASPGQCGAARACLSCSSPSGVTMLCMTDSLSGCPVGGPITVPGVTFSDCKDQCNSNEYVMACGGIGPGAPASSIEPPAACRALPPNPGGVSYYCCSCGS